MKQLFLSTSILFCFIILFGSCKDNKEVKIGNQIWTSRNLDVSSFSNGDPIPEAKTEEEWRAASSNQTPAWCYLENNPANGKKYGKLYNWYAVHDPRGLAPKGWHIPNNEEWSILIEYLGGEKKAGKKLKHGFRPPPFWQTACCRQPFSIMNRIKHLI